MTRWLVWEPDQFGHGYFYGHYVTGQTKAQAERKARALYGEQVWCQSEASHAVSPDRPERQLQAMRVEDRMWRIRKQHRDRDFYAKYGKRRWLELEDGDDWPKPAA